MVNSNKPTENTITTPTTPATPAPQGTGNPNDYYFPSRGFASEQKPLKIDFQTPDSEKIIMSQKRDAKFDPFYDPIKITILTGIYKGMDLDLGLNTVQLSESQQANWEDTPGKAIRAGANFSNISTRSLDLSIEFSSINEDVRPLVEAIAHLHEITDTSHTPPLVMITVGKTMIDPCVCESFDAQYDEPLPGAMGFRHCAVNLKFKMIGGKGTKHQLAQPLTNTPVKAIADKQSDLERQKQGERLIVKQQLAKCLGENGNKELENLLEGDKFKQVEEVLKLSPDTLIQLLVSGLIPKDVIDDPRMQEKLKQDLAFAIAEKRPGTNPIYKRPLGNGIYTNNYNGLEGVLKLEEFNQIMTDYNLILEGIKSGNLDKVSDAENISANRRIIDVAECGLSLKRIGTPILIGGTVSPSDSVILDGINKVLAENPSREKVIELFGLPPDTPETVIRKLLNSRPFRDKQDFLDRATPNQAGISSYVAWSNFAQQEARLLEKLNVVIPTMTDEDVKKVFEVSDPAEIAKLRHGGKPFKSKEEFVSVIGKSDRNRAIQLWEIMRKNQDKIPAATAGVETPVN
jgi:hypothetical protein